jgi:hypothetical protein
LNRLRNALFACAAGLCAISQARASVLALDFKPSASSQVSSAVPYTIGWQFTTNAPIYVNALDAFDPQLGSGSVWIFDSSSHTLASATIALTDPKVGTYNEFYSHSIAPVLLAAGQTYSIVENYNSLPAKFRARATVLTIAPQITFTKSLLANGLNGFPTSDKYGQVNNPAYFGPSFEFTPAAASVSAPEPGTFGIGAGVLFGLALLRRRALG